MLCSCVITLKDKYDTSCDCCHGLWILDSFYVHTHAHTCVHMHKHTRYNSIIENFSLDAIWFPVFVALMQISFAEVLMNVCVWGDGGGVGVREGRGRS